jgi:hypothetical protein
MHASFETVVALEMRDAIPNVSDIRISLILHNRDSFRAAPHPQAGCRREPVPITPQFRIVESDSLW